MTPSLANFLNSLFWSCIIVIIPISFTLITVSKIDPVIREENNF